MLSSAQQCTLESKKVSTVSTSVTTVSLTSVSAIVIRARNSSMADSSTTAVREG